MSYHTRRFNRTINEILADNNNTTITPIRQHPQQPKDDSLVLLSRTNTFYPKFEERILVQDDDEQERYKMIERVPDSRLYFGNVQPDSKILIYSGSPIYIGRWKEPYNPDSRTNGGYQLNQLAEHFVYSLCGEKNCTYTSENNRFSNVDIERKLRGLPHRQGEPQVQGLEVKLVMGHAIEPPFVIRGSLTQLKALQDVKKYAKPSGYVVVSRDFIRYDPYPFTRNGDWMYTLWFLNASNEDHWTAIQSNLDYLNRYPPIHSGIYFQVYQENANKNKRKSRARPSNITPTNLFPPGLVT